MLLQTTMAIMSKMREKRPESGYATDFVQITMKQIAPQIKASGVKVIANAGGVNPLAAREALEAVLSTQGIDLKVGVVLGDDLLPRVDELLKGVDVREMYTGEPLPANLKSCNAYLGARPIAKLLDDGCDIVLTGRVVDSAVTLGACMHEFGWRDNEYDALAGATLAGHIIECGAQATGGLFTDWEQVSTCAHAHAHATCTCHVPYATRHLHEPYAHAMHHGHRWLPIGRASGTRSQRSRRMVASP